MKPQKCVLSVNVNKIATLRNSRGGDVPNVLKCAQDLVAYGAEGITVHPRPDARHITHQDVLDLHLWLRKHNRRRRHHPVEFNIEGYPSATYMKLIQRVRPHQATLVPDPPHALTSNAGWDLARNEKKLTKIVRRLRSMGVRSSIFVDVYNFSQTDQKALARIRPDRVELYTEKYAHDYVTQKRASTTAKYAKVARIIDLLGIQINAGHDLNAANIQYLLKSVPSIIECSIGHALISESLYWGFKRTIQTYRRNMRRV